MSPSQPLSTSFLIGDLSMQSKILSDDAGILGQDVDDLNDTGTTTGAIVGGMKSSSETPEEEAIRALSTLNNQSDMREIVNVAQQYGVSRSEMSDLISLANQYSGLSERKSLLINSLGAYILGNLEQKRQPSEYDFADLPQIQDVEGDDEPRDVSLHGSSYGSSRTPGPLKYEDLTSDSPNIGLNPSVQTIEGMKAGIGTHIHTDKPQRKGMLIPKEQFDEVVDKFNVALDKGDMEKADEYLKLILNDDDIDVNELRDSFYEKGDEAVKEKLRSSHKTPQQIDKVIQLFEAEAELPKPIGDDDDDDEPITKPKRGRPRKEEIIPKKIYVRQYNSSENLPAAEISKNKDVMKYYKGKLTSASNSGDPKELMEARQKYVESSPSLQDGKIAWNKLMTAISKDKPEYIPKIKMFNVKFK
jgi:hypothetical protein